MISNPYVTEQDLRDTMNLAKARVYHYQSIGWTMFSREELISAANEGICEALIRFEPSKGTVKDTKLSSYAYFWIEKYLKEYITKNKTMLSASMGELWCGVVPYVSSFDAYDDTSNDGAGSDHKDWLGTDVLPSAAVEAYEYDETVHDLLAKMFLDLDRIERLVVQLSIGIGTINRQPLTIAEIARATRITRVNVQIILDNAYAKMREHAEEHRAELASVY